ncbi:ATP-grasp peptide maturase system methyltransferase [Streptomyces sp. NPDC047017]|uniref:ATP-grasp peptide maturase system methyltransferase n=1 Tax=Streptomyces sp. NPDC047017 TaxID=3155024 RepID=UPI0033E2C152
MTESAEERRRLAALLTRDGVLTTPWLRAAVEAVPRDLFLHPGVFLPEGGGKWRPVTAVGSDPDEWVRLAHSNQTLTTQLDGHVTADRVSEPVTGVPTSSSTIPTTVVDMIEKLGIEDGHRVLEIGTGTGYSTALMCHRLGEDNVTTVEVDPEVASRADAALEKAGISTWTATGDGLLGHPRNAPYDRVIATCAVRRVPYTWVRQTKPGGIILSTVGSWPYGTGLAKVTVDEEGNAHGGVIGRSSFMQARAQAVVPVSGDLSARTCYADSEREAKVPVRLLDEWMPAFLVQLAAPGAHLVRATAHDGRPLLYLFDPDRESFAEFIAGDGTWTVRQGGPVPLWDRVEEALLAWRAAGCPGIETVRLTITKESHSYWIDTDLHWEHRLD